MDTTLLEIENDKTILDYKNSKDIPIWLFMRNYFFEELSAIVNNDSPTQLSRKNGLKSVLYVIRSILFNVFKARKNKVDVIFYTISRETKVDGLFFNQYTDDYAGLFEKKAISIQHPPLDWSWKFPRMNNRIVFSAPNLVFSSLIGKIKSRKIDPMVKVTFNYAAERAKSIFNVVFDQKVKESILKNTVYEMTRMHLHSKWIQRFSKRRKAKLVVLLGGAYSWYYEINYRLKQSNIHTADLQHGIISTSNHVYNYGDSLLDNVYIKNGTPNYYLTYGEWWSTQTNMPFDKKISIGNVFREKQVCSFTKNRKNKIVFIGCNRKTKEYLELAKYIKQKCSNYDVVFRPHPTERYETSELCKKEDYLIDIDYGIDLYKQLSETNILISELSTVLFEAIGLVDSIIVWDTPLSKYLSPNHPFIKFESKENLLEIITKKDFVETQVDTMRVWKQDAISNFKEFCFEEGVYDKS